MSGCPFLSYLYWYPKIIFQYVMILSELNMLLPFIAIAALFTMSTRTPSVCVSDCSCNHDDDTPSHAQPSTNKITGKEIVFADELSELTKIMDDDTHMVLCKPKSTPGFIKKLSDQSILPEHLSFEGMVSFVVHIICRLQIMLSLMSIIYIYSRCLLYLVLWLRY